MTAFAYCCDCNELTTGVLDMSKGFRANEGRNTHWDHDVTPFADVSTLPTPIFNGIARLGAGLPVTDNAITMFRLGLDMHDYPTGALEAKCLPAPSTAPAVASTSTTCVASAPESAASMRSRPASRPTSATSAPKSSQVALW